MRSPLASPFRGGWRNLTPMRGRGRGGANPWTPAMLSPYAWYDAELGQPKNVGYVELSGVSGDYISTPDSAALSFSNDIEVVMRVRVTDWSTGSGQTLCGKYVSTGNQRSWRFYVSSTGAIGLTASANGTAVTSVTVTPTVAMTDAAWIWLRLRLDLTDGANSVGTVETAADTGDNVEPSSWTANGTNTGVIIAGVFDSSAPLEIGSFANGASERLVGSVGRCIVRSGFAGTVVADFNADVCYADGCADGYGNVWTVGNPKVYDRSTNLRAPLTAAAGSNAPAALPWKGTPSVYLPGLSGNYISCPDVPITTSGSIEFVLRLTMRDWTPSSNTALIAKWVGAGTSSFYIGIQTTGSIYAAYSSTGTGASNSYSSSALGFVDGSTRWIKLTFDTASGVSSLYVASDQEAEPTSWTLHHQATGTASAIFNSSVPIEIGSYVGGTSENLVGLVHRAIIRNAIGGSTAVDFDAALCTQSGCTDSVGNVWTVNRATSGRKPVVQSPAASSTRNLFLLGTDDYADVPAAALPSMGVAASGTVVMVIRQHATPASNGVYYSNKVATDAPNGKGIVFNAAGATLAIGGSIGDGTNGAATDSGTYTASTRVVCCIAIDARASATIRLNGASPVAMSGIASVGDATNATGGYIGRRGSSAAGYQDFEWEALLTFDRALTAAEIGQLVSYYRGGL